MLVKSRKAVGSSSSITGVCCASALAIMAFCLSPSLRLATLRRASSPMPTVAMAR